MNTIATNIALNDEDNTTIDVHLAKFAYDNSTAMLITNQYGEDMTDSINLSAYGMTPDSDVVFLKNNEFHTRIIDALIREGVVEKIGEVAYGPYDSTATTLKIVAK